MADENIRLLERMVLSGDSSSIIPLINAYSRAGQIIESPFIEIIKANFNDHEILEATCLHIWEHTLVNPETYTYGLVVLEILADLDFYARKAFVKIYQKYKSNFPFCQCPDCDSSTHPHQRNIIIQDRAKPCDACDADGYRDDDHESTVACPRCEGYGYEIFRNCPIFASPETGAYLELNTLPGQMVEIGWICSSCAEGQQGWNYQHHQLCPCDFCEADDSPTKPKRIENILKHLEAKKKLELKKKDGAVKNRACAFVGCTARATISDRGRYLCVPHYRASLG